MTATKINLNQEDYLYKFTFENKPDVFVAWTEPKNESELYWSEETIKTIDLSQYISSEDVKITYLINELDSQNRPIRKPNIIAKTNSIPLTSEPVFIEAIE